MNQDKKIHLISWQDSKGCLSGWQWADDIDNQAVFVTSVGIIIAEDEKSLTIAPHLAENTDGVQCMGAVTIAKCQIVTSYVLPASAFYGQGLGSEQMPLDV